jgi:hypothetical protein
MYQTLSEILTGAVVLLSMFLAALWRVAMARIGELRRALDAAERSAGEAQESAGRLGDMARLHERRASEFFGIITGVEKERDGWQRLYRESSQQAGVAQAWLIRDMGRVIQIGNQYAQRLRKHGETAPPVDVDPQLKQVVEEFAGTHALGHPEITSTDAAALAKAVDDPVPSGKVPTVGT